MEEIHLHFELWPKHWTMLNKLNLSESYILRIIGSSCLVNNSELGHYRVKIVCKLFSTVALSCDNMIPYCWIILWKWFSIEALTCVQFCWIILWKQFSTVELSCAQYCYLVKTELSSSCRTPALSVTPLQRLLQNCFQIAKSKNFWF